MGAKSTIDISRQEAIAKIESMLHQLHHLSNEALANVLETVNDELWYKQDWDNCLGLHNFHITG